MTARTLGIAAIATSALLGCGREPDEGTHDKSEGTAAPIASQAAQAREVVAAVAPTPLVQDALDAIPGGHVELQPPYGWTTQARGAWRVFESPDKLALLALAPLGARDSVPARLIEGVAELGATEMHVGDEVAITMGAERIPARAADGNCKLATVDARLEYAVIDAPGGKRSIMLRATAKTAPESAETAALTALTTLRRLPK